MKKITYSTLCRNKWLTSGAKSIPDMIKSHISSIEFLEELQKDGIQGDFSNAGDDHIYFKTDNAELAKKYDMVEEDLGEDPEAIEFFDFMNDSSELN